MNFTSEENKKKKRMAQVPNQKHQTFYNPIYDKSDSDSDSP